MKHCLKFLSKKEKQEIENKLKEQFGIKEIQGILIKRGEERIFLFQGNFAQNQIKSLEQEIPIERAGVYFAKEQNEKIRLSIEGVQILKDQIDKNIFKVRRVKNQLLQLGKKLIGSNFFPFFG